MVARYVKVYLKLSMKIYASLLFLQGVMPAEFDCNAEYCVRCAAEVVNYC